MEDFSELVNAIEGIEQEDIHFSSRSVNPNQSCLSDNQIDSSMEIEELCLQMDNLHVSIECEDNEEQKDERDNAQEHQIENPFQQYEEIVERIPRSYSRLSNSSSADHLFQQGDSMELPYNQDRLNQNDYHAQNNYDNCHHAHYRNHNNNYHYRPNYPCFYCDSPFHWYMDCHLRDVCFNCGMEGHWANECGYYFRQRRFKSHYRNYYCF